jgi:hypothetical protein
MSDDREVIESPLQQGADEEIAYQLTMTPWGSSPTNVSVKAYDITGGVYADVTSTVLTGNPTVSGDVITLPVLASLTAGKRYRIEVKFDSADGHTLEAYAIVEAEQ